VPTRPSPFPQLRPLERLRDLAVPVPSSCSSGVTI
jgi:hypothetical protein